MNPIVAQIVCVGTAILLVQVLPDEVLALIGCFALGWGSSTLGTWMSQQ